MNVCSSLHKKIEHNSESHSILDSTRSFVYISETKLSSNSASLVVCSVIWNPYGPRIWAEPFKHCSSLHDLLLAWDWLATKRNFFSYQIGISAGQVVPGLPALPCHHHAMEICLAFSYILREWKWKLEGFTISKPGGANSTSWVK